MSLAIAAVLLAGLAGTAGCRSSPPDVERADHVKLLRLVRAGGAKATLVNVWATWCEPCRKEMPDLLRLKERYGRAGFRLILVSADDPDSAETAVRSVLASSGVDFLSYVSQDTNDEAFISGMSPAWTGALPASFLYDRNGKLSEFVTGEKSYAEFEGKIAPLLK